MRVKSSYLFKEMTKFSRKSRVSELIRRELARMFQTFVFNNDTKSVFYLTVTEVTISNDLKNATVFILPFFPIQNNLDNQAILDSINIESHKIRKNLGLLNLRFTPKLRFKIDDLQEKTKKIDDLFNSPKVSQDLR